MNDKKKLSMLIELIKEFAGVPGNEWMKEELWTILKESGVRGTPLSNELFESIYEYCIEERIRHQANEFYLCFPVQELQSVLIEDFIKMEHERRRNDFEAVGLCVYQQIEAIVNYLYKAVVEPVWDSDREKVVTDYYDRKKGVQTTRTLEQQVFFKDKREWNATAKFKAVSYYCYYRESWSVFEMTSLVDKFRDVYLLRNKVHRDVTSKTNPNDSDRVSLAFRSYHFLADYVHHVRMFLLTNVHGNVETARVVYQEALKTLH
jgi:hypothetical protein